MQVHIHQIFGPWKEGYVLDKHTICSVPSGVDEYGRQRYDTQRTEVGEALFQLKYRNDTTQIEPLVKTFVKELGPMFSSIGFIVTMPPSKDRTQQPMELLAQGIAEGLNKPYFDTILKKIKQTEPMKNFDTKDEKIKALAPCITLNKTITNNGCWDVLLIDDLFDSGASLEVATNVLATYEKVNDIYVGAFTRTGG